MSKTKSKAKTNVGGAALTKRQKQRAASAALRDVRYQLNEWRHFHDVYASGDSVASDNYYNRCMTALSAKFKMQLREYSANRLIEDVEWDNG